MFVVTKRFGRSETRMGDFRQQKDAETFIQDKLQDDMRYKITATYGLYEGADLLREFTQRDVVRTESDSETTGSSGTGGASQRSSFTPTPFNTAPRPTGMPQSWVKDEEDKKK